MGVMICSSIKREGEEPEQWYATEKQAKHLFDLEVNWYCRRHNIKKIKWITKPEIIQKNGKFNIIGFAK